MPKKHVQTFQNRVGIIKNPEEKLKSRYVKVNVDNIDTYYLTAFFYNYAELTPTMPVGLCGKPYLGQERNI